MKHSMSNDDYKRLAIEKHGDLYDLSKTEYSGMRNHVLADCPIHGEFSIMAYDFAHKRGCPKCGIDNRSQQRINKQKKKKTRGKLTTEDFIKGAKEVFGDRYNYSKTDLSHRDKRGRVCIICPVHGEFWQNPYSHLHGHGCSKCGKKKGGSTQSLTTEEFIRKANEVHNFKYDYSLTEYHGCYAKVDIICPIHGKFTQSAYSHLNGHGCKQCAVDASAVNLASNTADFINKAKEIHGDNNDYTYVKYKNARTPVTIVCKKGHIYTQMPNKHLSGHSCPYCTNNISTQEKEIADYIKSLGFDVKTSDRKLLSDSKELDIIVPSKNIAIEFDGLYWHNEINKPDKNYHLNKTIECESKGLRLIHIFEDEWVDKKDIVKSRLNLILGGTFKKIYARNCVVKNIDSKACKDFLDKNHIQGGINSSTRYGLYFDGKLVSVMTFCKPRRNLGQGMSKNEYELLRFCNKLNTTVVGGASKLFKHFIKEVNPDSVITYADRRWNTGGVYEKMGFMFDHDSQPNYFYTIGQERHNRFGFRKDLLVKQGFDESKSEHEIMLERRIYRIYDCGAKVYKWFKK